LIHFDKKNYLKSNSNHTPKHLLEDYIIVICCNFRAYKIRGEQKNRKTDLTEKTGKKLTEKTEPVKKTD
jgi:hypothetical protein